MQKNENKLVFAEKLPLSNNRSSQAGKKPGGARGHAPQIKFDLGKFYAVLKLL